MSFRGTLSLALVAATLAGSGLTGFSMMTRPAAAQGEKSFLIPANDGYGVADCLASGGSCGNIVANAWCEAHGLGKAAQFGPVDPSDVTASIETTKVGASAKAYSVTCAE
jgi:hypothetical protein